MSDYPDSLTPPWKLLSMLTRDDVGPIEVKAAACFDGVCVLATWTWAKGIGWTVSVYDDASGSLRDLMVPVAGEPVPLEPPFYEPEEDEDSPLNPPPPFLPSGQIFPVLSRARDAQSGVLKRARELGLMTHFCVHQRQLGDGSPAFSSAEAKDQEDHIRIARQNLDGAILFWFQHLIAEGG